MQELRHLLRNWVVLTLLTIALVATGFAHRLPSADSAAMDAYVLAGGSLDDLCRDIDGDGKPDHGKCPACQIVGGAALTTGPVTLHAAALRIVATVAAPGESRAVRAVQDPAHASRAPPLA